MVMDALRGYVQLANGLTEVTRQRAQQAAKALVQQTGAESLTSGLSSRVSDLADEIVATSKSNRQLLQAIVANEVEGAVARLGFVRVEEVSALSRRIETLERQVAAATVAPSTPGPAAMAEEAAASTPTSTPASTAAAPGVKAPVKKAPVKKAAGSPGSVRPAAAKKVAAPTKAVSPAPAKTVSPAPAKTVSPAPAKKTPAKKAVGDQAPGSQPAGPESLGDQAAKKAPGRRA